jgi:hypothetical protein
MSKGIGPLDVNLGPLQVLDQLRRGVARERLVGTLVLPLVMFGVIEASITRRPSTPRTLSRASTTVRTSWPIRHRAIGVPGAVAEQGKHDDQA